MCNYISVLKLNGNHIPGYVHELHLLLSSVIQRIIRIMNAMDIAS